jgi:hypothetical protein
MDKIEQLFIRACKSKNPDQRLKSVYKRFYLEDLSGGRTFYDVMNALLTPIVDKYCPMSLEKYLIKSGNYVSYSNLQKENITNYQLHFWIIRDQLRFAPAGILYRLGYISPARFRNK